MASLHRRGITALVLVLVLGAGGFALRAALRRANAPDGRTVHGVTLGMTVRDVRARYVPAGPGRFRVGTAQEQVLDWLPDGEPPAAGVAPPARFEFHGGFLVAVRMSLPAQDPDAQGPEFDVSPAAVLARRRVGDGRVELTLLARDCPTHAAEVRRLLASR